ncbi:hypothetical protein RUM43_010066 [Polyplax serrata]|uniref:PID domain-containing protein n=1 Tax=Polyplax serrata TaxID=468196 RepID=A0AAN8PKV4_POLSC
MALLNKIRRDTKKSSYYVWFLGAQESKGLRGAEYITPVLRSLIEREKTVEPFKITLQVSHKGLKIIQNLSNLNAKPFLTKGDGKPDQKPNKNDVIKHFIPHHAVTCVLQEDDVVACILLLYNPVTRCPVHVHAYRCDSKETAILLTNQLTTLILRPDNQKKMNEIEGRLKAKGLLLPTVPRVNIPKRVNSSGSDGRSTTTSPASESSGGSAGSTGGCQNERITNLYDSLAAELREKLGMGTDNKASHAPILLPPRDYDTVHRQKGNLTGIEMRRCLNENIVDCWWIYYLYQGTPTILRNSEKATPSPKYRLLVR